MQNTLLTDAAKRPHPFYILFQTKCVLIHFPGHWMQRVECMHQFQFVLDCLRSEQAEPFPRLLELLYCA